MFCKGDRRKLTGLAIGRLIRSIIDRSLVPPLNGSK